MKTKVASAVLAASVVLGIGFLLGLGTRPSSRPQPVVPTAATPPAPASSPRREIVAPVFELRSPRPALAREQVPTPEQEPAPAPRAQPQPAGGFCRGGHGSASPTNSRALGTVGPARCPDCAPR